MSKNQARCSITVLIKTFRDWFRGQPLVLTPNGWEVAGKCYAKAPQSLFGTASDATLLPPPKEWEASNFESAALEKFYRETLEIKDVSLDSILLEFEQELDFTRAKQLYHALQMVHSELSNNDVKRIR